ncbi:MAG: tetratricopeptide repeat protein [Pseudomonadota bacterium]
MALTPKNSNQDDPSSTKISAEDEIAMREIDEAVRKDDAADFAKKYGVMIGSVVGLGLAGFAGYLFWDSQVESALEAESEQLVSVIDYAEAGDYPSVLDRSAPLLDAETPGIRTSARFLQAGAALERGEVDRAVAMYAKIADDENAPQALRDFARLREVVSNYDERNPEEIIAKLKDLAVPGHPFFASAAELTAHAHIEMGNLAEAGDLFAAIAKDDTMPGALRDRAQQMTGQLGVDTVDNVQELLDDMGVTSDSANSGAAGAAPSAQ